MIESVRAAQSGWGSPGEHGGSNLEGWWLTVTPQAFQQQTDTQGAVFGKSTESPMTAQLRHSGGNGLLEGELQERD